LKTVIVAAGVLIDGERVLLSQRRADTHLAGMWEFPGGKVESGEDPREALRRELEEELGVDAIVGDIVDVAFHRYDDANKAVLLLFYEATLTTESKAPRAIDVAAVKWATREDLDPALFPPADVGVLAKVKVWLGGGGQRT
jgi:8-oxo-dGTP diphosphatase